MIEPYVYVVLKTAPYEFGGIMGVFSTQAAAKEFADKLRLKQGDYNYYDFDVEQYTLNTPPQAI